MPVSDKAALSERTIRAGFWTIGARLASRGLDFVTLLVLARFLEPADFGLVATAMTVIFVLEAVLELPLSSVLIRLPEVSDRAYHTAFTLGLLRGLLLTLIMIGLSRPLALFYGDDRLVPLIAVLSAAPALRGMVSPRMVIFDKAMNFRQRGMLELIGKTAAAAIAITIAISTHSYWAIAAGTLTVPAAMTIASYVLAPMRPRLTVADWPLFSQMISWNFVSQTLGAFNWQIDRILLPRFIDTAAFGRFAAANDLASLPSQAIVAPATGPLISAFVVAQENDRLKQAYLKSSASFLLVLLPVLIFLAVCAGPVIKVLLGPKWEAAAPILAGLSLGGILALPSIPMLPLALALNRSRDLAIRSGIELLCRLPLSLAGVALFGIQGAILARAGSALAVCLSSLSLTKTMAGISIRDQLAVTVRPGLSALPACAMLLVCQHVFAYEALLYLEFLVSGLAYCLTYAAAAFALWLMAGRPEGVEASILALVSRYRGRTALH